MYDNSGALSGLRDRDWKLYVVTEMCFGFSSFFVKVQSIEWLATWRPSRDNSCERPPELLRNYPSKVKLTLTP